MKKDGFKAKFRRVSAKAPLKEEVIVGGAATGLGGVLIGLPMIFIDGGITLSIAAATTLSSLIAAGSLSDESTADLKNHYDKDYNTIIFDGKKYYTGVRQGFALRKLDKKIKKLEKEFNAAETNSRRNKIQRKIQKHVDHQIDILKSENVSTEKPAPKPKEELVELKVNKSFRRNVRDN